MLYITISGQLFPSIPPEYISFLCIQGVQQESIDLKWINKKKKKLSEGATGGVL